MATARVKGAAKLEIPHVDDHVSKIDCVGLQVRWQSAGGSLAWQQQTGRTRPLCSHLPLPIACCLGCMNTLQLVPPQLTLAPSTRL